MILSLMSSMILQFSELCSLHAPELLTRLFTRINRHVSRIGLVSLLETHVRGVSERARREVIRGRSNH